MGSGVLESRQHGDKLPPLTLNFLPESLHFGIQVLENLWLFVIKHRLINHLLQFIPGQRLTHAGSRLTCAGSRLTRAGSRLVFESVVDHLKLNKARLIGQPISYSDKKGNVCIEFILKGVELPIINKVFHESLHVLIQVCENLWRFVFLDRLNNC